MEEYKKHEPAAESTMPVNQISMWNAIRCDRATRQVSPFAINPLEEARRRLLAKHTPDFDPDAEITGLTLTIPSWTSSIGRMRSNTDMSTVSIKARKNLEHALFDLRTTIEELLRAIKE